MTDTVTVPTFRLFLEVRGCALEELLATALYTERSLFTETSRLSFWRRLPTAVEPVRLEIFSDIFPTLEIQRKLKGFWLRVEFILFKFQKRVAFLSLEIALVLLLLRRATRLAKCLGRTKGKVRRSYRSRHSRGFLDGVRGSGFDAELKSSLVHVRIRFRSSREGFRPV